MAQWREIVRTVAPALAGALGGPLAGNVVRMLGDKLLGNPNASEDEVSAAVVAMSPADLVKLREIEADLTKTLAANGIRLEELDAQDRDSARRRATEARDWTPSILTFLYFGLVAVIIIGMMAGELTLPDNQIVAMLIGGIVGAWTQSNNFQFGTTRGSSDKNKTIAGLMDKKNGVAS